MMRDVRSADLRVRWNRRAGLAQIADCAGEAGTGLTDSPTGAADGDADQDAGLSGPPAEND